MIGQILQVITQIISFSNLSLELLLLVLNSGLLLAFFDLSVMCLCQGLSVHHNLLLHSNELLLSTVGDTLNLRIV